MTAFTQPVGSFTSLTVTGLGTLANVTYVASADIDLTSGPLDVQIEVEATPNGSVTGNKQLVIFAQSSIDGTDYTTGPTSGTTTTDEPVLKYVGRLPLPSNSTQQRDTFHLLNVWPTMPKHARLVFKNDCGVALSAAAVQVALVTGLGT